MNSANFAVNVQVLNKEICYHSEKKAIHREVQTIKPHRLIGHMSTALVGSVSSTAKN